MAVRLGEVVSYVGAVLSLEIKDWSDDWDNVAVVWTGEGIDKVVYGTTRGVMNGSAEVDATPEVLAAYAAYCAKHKAEADARYAEELAARPSVGKTVKVVRGRKVPKGTVGEVVWYGKGRPFKPWLPAPVRVGVRDANGTVHWTDAKNVEVVNAAKAA